MALEFVRSFAYSDDDLAFLSQIRDDVQNYFNANPQEEADLESIRQPLTDIRQRCQWTPLLGQGGVAP